MSLDKERCIPCEGGVPPLTKEEVTELLKDVKGWECNPEFTAISQTFAFTGYYKTIAFVNALAWMANQQMHHPDLEVHYDNVKVIYQTHAINGLSKNDFICAARTNALFYKET